MFSKFSHTQSITLSTSFSFRRPINLQIGRQIKEHIWWWQRQEEQQGRMRWRQTKTRMDGWASWLLVWWHRVRDNSNSYESRAHSPPATFLPWGDHVESLPSVGTNSLAIQWYKNFIFISPVDPLLYGEANKIDVVNPEWSSLWICFNILHQVWNSCHLKWFHHCQCQHHHHKNNLARLRVIPHESEEVVCLRINTKRAQDPSFEVADDVIDWGLLDQVSTKWT